MTANGAPLDEAELELLLSEPDEAVRRTLAEIPGDIIVLGAGGKMGPSLTRMLWRACDEARDPRRIIAVSRFSDDRVAGQLRHSGISVVRADLTDPDAVAGLPDAPNVIFMAGQKFGTTGQPATTWAMNVLVPASVARRYPTSRIVAFSTGNVYPLTAVASGGAREEHPLTPLGEYANSCVGRERIFEWHAERYHTSISIVRLSYAVDLRYGVLVDIALRVRDGLPVDLANGYVNVIWQGDANARAIECLARASSPPFVVNVTGRDMLSVRAIATQFAEQLGREPRFANEEAPEALLSDTTRMVETLAPLRVSSDTLIAWVAAWTSQGGRTLGKPTHFETRDGAY